MGVPWVPEYARGYAARKGSDLLESDIEPIARGQLALETRALLAEVPLIIYDTDLLSTAVYAEHYYGWCPEWVRQASRQKSGLYLLLDIDVPFVPDPTRGPAVRREELHQRFLRALEDAGLRHATLSGGWAERLTKARELVASEAGDSSGRPAGR
jgi:nicotinamide riboside kinase